MKSFPGEKNSKILVGTASWSDPGFVEKWYPKKMRAAVSLACRELAYIHTAIHSWAQRAKACGYPQRFAQDALAITAVLCMKLTQKVRWSFSLLSMITSKCMRPKSSRYLQPRSLRVEAPFDTFLTFA